MLERILYFGKKLEKELTYIEDSVYKDILQNNKIPLFLKDKFGIENWEIESNINYSTILEPSIKDMHLLITLIRCINLPVDVELANGDYSNSHNIDKIYNEISKENGVNQKDFANFLCFSFFNGYIDLDTSQKLEFTFKEGYTSSNETLLKKFYLLECILTFVYSSPPRSIEFKQFTCKIEKEQLKNFWFEYMIKTIEKNSIYKKDLSTMIAKVEELQKENEEKYQKNLTAFFGRNIELMAIFVAVFAIICSNIGMRDFSAYALILTNLTIVLSLLIIFKMIDFIVNKSFNNRCFYFIIVTLVFLLIFILFFNTFYT